MLRPVAPRQEELAPQYLKLRVQDKGHDAESLWWETPTYGSVNGLRASSAARAGDVSTYIPTIHVILITDGVVRRYVSGLLQPWADNSSKEEKKIEVVLIESLLRLSNGSHNYIYVRFGCSGCPSDYGMVWPDSTNHVGILYSLFSPGVYRIITASWSSRKEDSWDRKRKEE